MKTSPKMIYPAKILYATFLTATLVTICTLQAMERPYEDSEQTAQTQKIITLHCSDRTIFNVRYEIVIQSKTIMDVIENPNSPSISITIAKSISSKIMTDMINYMQMVTLAQAERCSKINIFLRLMAEISKSCTDQTLLDYIAAANYLNFKTLLRALCVVLAQRLDPVSGITRFRLNDMCYGVYKSLQKASFLYCHQHLDVGKPVAIEVNDLVDFGILDDVTSLNNKLEECIIHLITTSQYQALQSVLDVLSKNSNSLSIKAHEVLVAHARSLKHDGIKKLFATLERESTLKMALRLVYAKDFNINLDNLDCVYFFGNIGNWVNGVGFASTLLFSQAYLQYVLPLIEPVTKVLVTELFLSEKQLTSLPDSISNLINVKELWLKDNQLTSLPASIGNLSNLTQLSVNNNQLTSLPDSIGNLVNLKGLGLAKNKLTSLPDSISNLSNLTSLYLYCNELSSLPDSMSNLVNLTVLDLWKNQLTKLPDSLCNLSKLNALNLTSNQLTNETKRQLKQKFKRLYDGLII